MMTSYRSNVALETHQNRNYWTSGCHSQVQNFMLEYEPKGSLVRDDSELIPIQYKKVRFVQVSSHQIEMILTGPLK